MQFAEGDTVVHPHHGLAKVVGVSTRDIGNGPADYVHLEFESNGMTSTIPVASLEEIGIRPPVTAEEANVLLTILDEASEVPTEWSERSAATVSRIRSAELGQALMVIRDLSRHAARIDKPLTAAEKASLEGCLDTVTVELSLALEMSREDTRELILSKVRLPADSVSADDDNDPADNVSADSAV